MSPDAKEGLAHEQEESDLLHLRVQTVLRAGLALSVALMVAGSIVRLAVGRTDAPAVKLFALFDTSDPSLLLLALGIFVLALTPAMRVVALVYLWWRERDYRFVGVAMLVIVTLVASVMLGRGG